MPLHEFHTIRLCRTQIFHGQAREKFHASEIVRMYPVLAKLWRLWSVSITIDS